MRRSFEVVLFYIMATAATNLVTRAVPGISIAHGTGAAKKQLESSIAGFAPGSGIGDTLFGSLLAGLNTLEAISQSIFALPILMSNLGVPGPIIVFLMAPAGFVILYDGIHIVTGRLAR